MVSTNMFSVFLVYIFFSYIRHEISCEPDAMYMGCYRDGGAPNRLFQHEIVRVRRKLTPKFCNDHCYGKGYAFAGTEDGFQCFCSSTKPPEDKRIEDSRCRKTCSGDKSKTCGGTNSLSVFSIGAPEQQGTGKVQRSQRSLHYRYPVITTTFDRIYLFDLLDVVYSSQNFVGCFNDSSTRLFTHKHGFPGTLTNQLCLNYCTQSQYQYAGTEYGNECHCSNEEPNPNLQVGLKNCNFSCDGNLKEYCGGFWSMAVFSTNIKPPVQGIDGDILNWHPIGCFWDSESRTFPYFREFPGSLTNEVCIKHCAQRGYHYAGTEFGKQCFCGDEKPSPTLEAGQEHCKMPCEGNQRENCGGFWGLSVSSINSPIVPAPADQGLSHPFNNRLPRRPSWTSDVWCLLTRRCPSKDGGASSAGDQVTPPVQSTTPNSCDRSETIVPGRTVCKGEVVFEDDFDSPLDEKWRYDTMISDEPELGFAVFGPENSFTKNSKLVIKPEVLNDTFVTSGSLVFDSCTGKPGTKQCGYKARGNSILPPVKSARIYTKDSFSFRYGKVEIRAKLPLGDWLVPELWLEPQSPSYGQDLASGRIRIAMNRGNDDYKCNGEDFGSSFLESGVVMSPLTNLKTVRRRSLTTRLPENWNNDFHNYILIWTPEKISFQIDDEEPQDVLGLESNGQRLCDVIDFENECSSGSKPWSSGSKIAPFDKDFYISLGLSVGNAMDFPDECTNKGQTKPWRNSDNKAVLKFWQDKENWLPTWTEDRSSLYIEHIRVTALE